MTREIKFRAWSESEKRFALNDEFMWVTRFGVLYENPKAMYIGVDSNIKLMQFTGLHDKNGVEIYEGDIITRNSGGLMGDGEPIYTGKIEFRRLSFMVVYSSVKVQNTDLVEVVEHEGHLVNSSELEVIGNVYENPELLEAQS